MADDRDDARLDRIRNTRSVIGRLDDVWVAVTDGNDRLAAAIDGLRGAPAPPGTAGGPAADGLHLRLNRIEEALAAVAETLAGVADEVGTLGRRVDALARALEAQAADAPLTQRLTRLREQFRRP